MHPYIAEKLAAEHRRDMLRAARAHNLGASRRRGVAGWLRVGRARLRIAGRRPLRPVTSNHLCGVEP
jgi:hypothetical protein